MPGHIARHGSRSVLFARVSWTSLALFARMCSYVLSASCGMLPVIVPPPHAGAHGSSWRFAPRCSALARSCVLTQPATLPTCATLPRAAHRTAHACVVRTSTACWCTQPAIGLSHCAASRTHGCYEPRDDARGLFWVCPRAHLSSSCSSERPVGPFARTAAPPRAHAGWMGARASPLAPTCTCTCA